MKRFTVACIVGFCLFFVGSVEAANPDGEAIYKQRCANCHGQAGEVPKGAATQGIKMLSSAEVEQKLRGYLDGSYGGASKSLMQNVARGVSPEELQALADYIGNFKK